GGGREQPVAVGGADAHQDPAVVGGADRHVAGEEERQPAEHPLLGQVRLARQQVADPLGERLVVRHGTGRYARAATGRAGWGVVTTSARRSGLDLRWVDPATRPQDDLFSHVNGKWLQTHVIPDDRAQDGAFRERYDKAERDVRAIIEQAAGEPGTDERKIADLYASFMDVERIEALGTAPLRPLLDEVMTAADKAALAAVLGRRQREASTALFAAFVSTDPKNASRYLVQLEQSGLGLPDESYYREDAYAEIREKYVAHLARLAELVGLPDPAGLAERVMDLETALAAASWDRVTNRDAEKTYTLMTLPALQQNAPEFDWEPWRAAFEAGREDGSA